MTRQEKKHITTLSFNLITDKLASMSILYIFLY